MNKIEQSKQTFNRQASTYDTSYSGMHARKLYPYMVDHIIRLPVVRVLDVGCGTCALMKQLWEEDPSRSFYGLDISEEMLKRGEQTMQGRAHLQQGAAHALPYETQFFDLVYCNDSFHHYSDPHQVLKEMHRVLKPGGILVLGDCYQRGINQWIMNVYFRYSKGGDVHMYSEKEITALLEEYFHHIQFQRLPEHAFLVQATK